METPEIQIVQEDPKRYDPQYSYGIIDEQPKPLDILYRLEYDADKGYLKLNSFVVQTFKWGSNADEVFTRLYRKKDRLIRETEVNIPADANVIVNNIKMPLSLRNALFRVGNDGHRLQITSRITRERAKKFNIRKSEVEDYITKCRDKHYKLLDSNKRK